MRSTQAGSARGPVLVATLAAVLIVAEAGFGARSSVTTGGLNMARTESRVGGASHRHVAADPTAALQTGPAGPGSAPAATPGAGADPLWADRAGADPEAPISLSGTWQTTTGAEPSTGHYDVPFPGDVPGAVIGDPGQFTTEWDLWVDGPHLRGANIYQRRRYPSIDPPDWFGPGPLGPPYVQADFDALAALGANVVVVSHPGVFTETPPFRADGGVVANLDNLLTMIGNADLFAVIAFRTGPGRNEFTIVPELIDYFPPGEVSIDDSVWIDSAAQDGWAEMWRYAAQRYDSNPVVVGYEVMVEPNDVDRLERLTGNDAWWDPEYFYARRGGKIDDWNLFAPKIAAAIRGVDPDTPIIAGGEAYSGVDWLPYLRPLTTARSVATVHQYAPYEYTHQVPGTSASYPGMLDLDWDGTPDVFDNNWLTGFLGLLNTYSTTHQVPIAATEFGLRRSAPGAASFLADEIARFETTGANHAIWMWYPSWPPMAAEDDDFNFLHGPDPDNHTAVPNALTDAIAAAWARNVARPSTVTFGGS